MSRIEVADVSLTYPIYGASARSFRSSLVNMITGGSLHKDSGKMVVTAIKNVSFSLEKGDRLALIGHNGAGKSTLLKVLAGIYAPTKGHVHVEGRLSCLFDIMMGMDLELTGYENIMLRGLILGLSKAETIRVVPLVEQFAELGDFIKMPIKSYSAGMKVRLAFGIITHIFSEILLIDEIVSVGDANFIEKAKARMRNLIDQADFVVLSTHDLTFTKELCNKVLWLDHGELRFFGDVEEGIDRYLMRKQVNQGVGL